MVQSLVHSLNVSNGSSTKEIARSRSRSRSRNRIRSDRCTAVFLYKQPKQNIFSFSYGVLACLLTFLRTAYICSLLELFAVDHDNCC
jgi:hypothetical protein